MFLVINYTSWILGYILNVIDMVPKEIGFNQSKMSCALCVRTLWRFPGSLAMARDSEVLQKQRFCQHGDTICHPKSGYVTTKLHRTSTCGCNNNAIFSDSYFHVSYHRRILATLIWPHQSLGSSCQNTEMATLLNSISFVFKISFQPKYRAILLWLYCKEVQFDKL